MMTRISRQALEGSQRQGVDETIIYTITTTNWGSTPTSPSAKIFAYSTDTKTYSDVTADRMSGSASESGDVITLPAISGLTEGIKYRVEVQFTISGNIFEPWFVIRAER